MNLKLIQSLLPDIEKYFKTYTTKHDFNINDYVKDINDKQSYYNEEFWDIIFEFFENSLSVYDCDYELDEHITMFTTVIKLDDSRYIRFPNWFDHNHGYTIYDEYEVKELLSLVKQVYPSSRMITVYE
jgi:hypothetical protein